MGQGDTREGHSRGMKPLLCGLIGAGIQGSRSPALHEAEAAAQGLKLAYKLIDLDVLDVGAEELPALLGDAERKGYCGVNITFPCKQAVIPLLDELSEDARALGAVNTVLFRDGKRTGRNTDWSGFAESFRRGLPGAKRDHVVQLGAGGAGAAVAYAAMRLGVRRLSIFDIDEARAAELAAKLGEGAGAGGNFEAAMPEADGLVHCTPTGMAKYPGMPLAAELLQARQWVAEVVYVPLETELLRVARAKGCQTLDGGGMAVFQAAGAFRLFTGVEPDAERMLRHFQSM
jgi:shikimate dehydrogenase